MSRQDIQTLLIGLIFLVSLNGCAAALGMTPLSVSVPALLPVLQCHTRWTGLLTERSPPRSHKLKAPHALPSNRMGIKIQATSKTEQGKAIRALSNDREIEIELEMVSAKTTRIRTVAKQGIFFKDRATATEIIMQTERVLGVG
jgi:hypothetical protein